MTAGGSGDQLEVVRLVGDVAVAEAARDLPVAQEEDARHLVAVVLDAANNLYVAWSTIPKVVITKDFTTPLALAIGPP